MGRELGTGLFRRRTLEGKQDRVNDFVRDYTDKARKKLLRDDDELGRQVEAARQDRNSDLAIAIEQAAVEAEAQDGPDLEDLLSAGQQ